MPRLIVAAVLAASVACAGARPATRAGDAAAPRPDAKADSGTRVVCYDETPTGSHISVRTCHPVADDLQRDRGRDAMIDQLRRPAGGAPVRSGGG